MDRIAALSTGTKLVLAGGLLLLVDLFLTWQETPLNYGKKFDDVTQPLDGWDFWGLLIGLVTLALLAIVVIRETDSELLLDSRWDRATLILGGLVFPLAVVKNLRDADSAWASYVGLVLAALVAVGAYLEWTRIKSDEVPVHTAWQPRPAGPSASHPRATDRRSDEPREKW